MAVLPGQIFASATWGSSANPNISDDLGGFSGNIWRAAGSAESIGLFGARTRVNGDQVPASRSGFKATSFADDFYHRIHLSPSSISAGNIINDKNAPLRVWNAYLEPRTVNAVTVTGDAGVSIATPGTPFALQPLQESTYTVTILANSGASTLEASIALDFATAGDDQEITVFGLRVTAFPFPPDWQRGVIERLEWLTDILTSYNGTEQRVALRQAPRRSVEYNYLVITPQERRRLENIFFAWGAQRWAVPIWTDCTTLSGEIPAGTEYLPIQPGSYDYHVGGMLIFMAGTGQYEVYEIQALAPGGITLTTETTIDWPVGTKICPVRIGLMDDTNKLRRWSGDSFFGTVKFRFVDQSEFAPATESTTHQGHPVMEMPPNWVRDITADYQRKLEQLDFRVGGWTHEDESLMPEVISAHHWTLINRTRVDNFRAWLYTRRGRYKATWVPTFTCDLVVVADIVLTASTLDIEHCGYAQYIAMMENRRDIRIELRNGTVFYRRILAATEISGAVERITMDSALGVNVAAAGILRVSFMALSRLDSDAVELAWWTDTVAEVTANFRAVRLGTDTEL